MNIFEALWQEHEIQRELVDKLIKINTGILRKEKYF